MVKDRTLMAVIEAVFRNTVNIGTGLILLLAAGRLSVTGEAGISLGEFALFVFLLHHVTETAYFYGVFIARAKQGSVSAERLTAALSGEPWSRIIEDTDLGLDTEDLPMVAPVEETEPFEITISVRDVSYHYNGSRNGIENVSPRDRASESSWWSPAGSGPERQRCSVRFLDCYQRRAAPSDGTTSAWEIHRRSSCHHGSPTHHRYLDCSRCPSRTILCSVQSWRMDSWTSRSISQRCDATSTRCQMGSRRSSGSRGVRLSGGQVQRSAAARMFTRSPQLLVLDDVSSALDVETEQLLWNEAVRGAIRCRCPRRFASPCCPREG